MSTKNSGIETITLTKEEIMSVSHLPLILATVVLRMEVNVLKKKCRELGIKRW